MTDRACPTNERGRLGTRQPRFVTGNETTLPDDSGSGPLGQANDARAIHIRRCGSAYRVSVEPPLEDVDFSATKESLKAALGFANMVGKLRCLPVVNETEGGRA